MQAVDRVVLTIGGSDSGGGAGIQADLKTFSVLGLHGTSAVTAVTAQNTMGVQRIFELRADAVIAQLQSITDDFSISYAKTGMLHTAEIVEAVAGHFRKTGIPFVLDPVIEAEAGGRLLRPEAVSAVKELLIPLAAVVTPNIFEAEALIGVHVSDLATADLASLEIMALGAKAVVVKGGHLDCTDLLRAGAEVHHLPGKRMAGGNHGVGCTYSAALTSFLALGCSLPEAARKGKDFAAQSVAHGMNVGQGAGPVNQAAGMRMEAERFGVLCNVQSAVEMLLDEPKLPGLIPGSGSSIGMAIAGAVSHQDVAWIEGKLVWAGRRALLCGCVKFGADGAYEADGSAACTILKAMSFAPHLRAAMNLSPEALPGCTSLGLHMGEGLPKGLGSGSLPDVILERGAAGREPTLWLLGTGATQVATRAVKLARLPGDGKI